MTGWQPAQGFLEALTMLDTGETDLIITPDAESVEWAREHGYRIVAADMNGMAVYEIRPGDDGAVRP